MFDTEIEAAVAYDAAVLELFGPEMPTNFDSEFGAPHISPNIRPRLCPAPYVVRLHNFSMQVLHLACE